MKNIIYILLTLFSINIIFSQNPNKKDYTVIYFKDSSSVKGKKLVHNTNTFNPSGIVKFTDNRKSKKNKYKPENIDYIKYFFYYDISSYVELKEMLKALPKKQQKEMNIDSLLIGIDDIMKNGKIKEGYLEKKVLFLKINDIYKLCDVLVEGKVSLYKSSGFGQAGNVEYYYEDYYTKRKFERTAYKISKDKISNKRFIKKATEYFKDCSEIITKINEEKFTSKNINEIVKFYNKKCD